MTAPKPTEERLTKFTSSATLPELERLGEIATATRYSRAALIREGMRRIAAEYERRGEVSVKP